MKKTIKIDTDYMWIIFEALDLYEHAAYSFTPDTRYVAELISRIISDLKKQAGIKEEK